MQHHSSKDMSYLMTDRSCWTLCPIQLHLWARSSHHPHVERSTSPQDDDQILLPAAVSIAYYSITESFLVYTCSMWQQTYGAMNVNVVQKLSECQCSECGKVFKRFCVSFSTCMWFPLTIIKLAGGTLSRLCLVGRKMPRLPRRCSSFLLYLPACRSPNHLCVFVDLML